MVVPYVTLTAPAPRRAQGAIRQALAAARRHLGMEVAYVSAFVGDRAVFREVDAPGLEALIRPGDARPLDEMYCPHILAGRLPELMADTADFPLAWGMSITRTARIGAHASVPLRLPKGRAHGMFCCYSPHANRSLNDRDLQVMKAFAEMAGLMSLRVDQGQDAPTDLRGACAMLESERLAV